MLAAVTRNTLGKDALTPFGLANLLDRYQSLPKLVQSLQEAPNQRRRIQLIRQISTTISSATDTTPILEVLLYLETITDAHLKMNLIKMNADQLRRKLIEFMVTHVSNPLASEEDNQESQVTLLGKTLSKKSLNKLLNTMLRPDHPLYQYTTLIFSSLKPNDPGAREQALLLRALQLYTFQAAVSSPEAQGVIFTDEPEAPGADDDIDDLDQELPSYQAAQPQISDQPCWSMSDAINNMLLYNSESHATRDVLKTLIWNDWTLFLTVFNQVPVDRKIEIYEATLQAIQAPPTASASASQGKLPQPLVDWVFQTELTLYTQNIKPVEKAIRRANRKLQAASSKKDHEAAQAATAELKAAKKVLSKFQNSAFHSLAKICFANRRSATIIQLAQQCPEEIMVHLSANDGGLPYKRDTILQGLTKGFTGYVGANPQYSLTTNPYAHALLLRFHKKSQELMRGLTRQLTVKERVTKSGKPMYTESGALANPDDTKTVIRKNHADFIEELLNNIRRITGHDDSVQAQLLQSLSLHTVDSDHANGEFYMPEPDIGSGKDKLDLFLEKLESHVVTPPQSWGQVALNFLFASLVAVTQTPNTVRWSAVVALLRQLPRELRASLLSRIKLTWKAPDTTEQQSDSCFTALDLTSSEKVETKLFNLLNSLFGTNHTTANKILGHLLGNLGEDNLPALLTRLEENGYAALTDKKGEILQLLHKIRELQLLQQTLLLGILSGRSDKHTMSKKPSAKLLNEIISKAPKCAKLFFTLICAHRFSPGDELIHSSVKVIAKCRKVIQSRPNLEWDSGATFKQNLKQLLTPTIEALSDTHDSSKPSRIHQELITLYAQLDNEQLHDQELSIALFEMMESLATTPAQTTTTNEALAIIIHTANVHYRAQLRETIPTSLHQKGGLEPTAEEAEDTISLMVQSLRTGADTQESSASTLSASTAHSSVNTMSRALNLGPQDFAKIFLPAGAEFDLAAFRAEAKLLGGPQPAHPPRREKKARQALPKAPRHQTWQQVLDGGEDMPPPADGEEAGGDYFEASGSHDLLACGSALATRLRPALGTSEHDGGAAESKAAGTGPGAMAHSVLLPRQQPRGDGGRRQSRSFSVLDGMQDQMKF